MSVGVTACDATGPELGRTATIRRLNDEVRRFGRGGRVMLTAGVEAPPAAEIAATTCAVASFDTFAADNDPYGEHDCAILTVGSNRLLWNIDAYDRDLRFASPDPTEPAVTHILTVMLAEEY